MDLLKKKFKNVLKKDLKLLRIQTKIENDHRFINSLIKKNNYNGLQLFLSSILDKLKSYDKLDVFTRPVNPQEVPTYYKIIKEPMCFEQMQTKLRNGKYINFNMFEADFKLIVSNCLSFNKKDDYYYRAGVNLETNASKILQVARQTYFNNPYLQQFQHPKPKFELKVVYHTKQELDNINVFDESITSDGTSSDDEDEYYSNDAPLCLKRTLSTTESNSSSQGTLKRPRLDTLNNLLNELLENLKSFDKLGIFLKPVDPVDIPTYYEKINEPMDFQTMQDKLNNNEYSTMELFERDFELIYSNCLKFNHPNDKYYLAGKHLKDNGLKIIQESRKMIQINDHPQILEFNLNEEYARTMAKFDELNKYRDERLADMKSLKEDVESLKKVCENILANEENKEKDFTKQLKKIEIKLIKLDNNEINQLKQQYKGLKIKL